MTSSSNEPIEHSGNDSTVDSTVDDADDSVDNNADKHDSEYGRLIREEGKRLSGEYAFLTQGNSTGSGEDPAVHGLYLGRDGSVWLLTEGRVSALLFDNFTGEWDVSNLWIDCGLPDEYAPFLRINPSAYGLGVPYSKPRVMPSARHRDEDDHADNDC